MFKKLFTEHPAAVQETYIEHLIHAMSFSLKLFKAAFACLVHALVPGLCIKTGSRAITELHHSMVLFRVKDTKKPLPKNAFESAPEYMI